MTTAVERQAEEHAASIKERKGDAVAAVTVLGVEHDADGGRTVYAEVAVTVFDGRDIEVRGKNGIAFRFAPEQIGDRGPNVREIATIYDLDHEDGA